MPSEASLYCGGNKFVTEVKYKLIKQVCRRKVLKFTELIIATVNISGEPYKAPYWSTPAELLIVKNLYRIDIIFLILRSVVAIKFDITYTINFSVVLL